MTRVIGRNPNSIPADPGIILAPAANGVESISVPSVVFEPGVTQQTLRSASALASSNLDLVVMDNIKPLADNDKGRNQNSKDRAASEILVNQSTAFMAAANQEQPLAPPVLSLGFDSLGFNDNASQNGTFNIPPDSDSAIGTHYVVNVVNSIIQFHKKDDGTVVFTDSLYDFFSAESPNTNTFDPKVIFDPREGRFVVVTLEKEDDGADGNPEVSKIFVAVSDDANPNGTWCSTTIDGKTFINGRDRWADYPGFAVDEEAVYITANMFGFEESGENSSVAVRLWIIEKGVESNGFFDCGTAVVTKHDPLVSGGFVTTLQPAQMHGQTPAGVGTFLSGYNGLSFTSGDEAVQVIRVDNPLGQTSFTTNFVNISDIEDFSSFSGAPQLGEAALIDTGDRRVLDAEWYDGSLWFTASISPKAGDLDAGEITAHWWEIDTASFSFPVLVQQGNIFGDDLIADLWTYYPSVAISGGGHVAFGFSGSAATAYGGSYYTTRTAEDLVGMTKGTALLKDGEGPYLRKFCGNDNRWGDYSSTDVDPVNGAFWFYNQHALATGNSFDCNPEPSEAGRWGTYNGYTLTGALPIDQWLEDMELTNVWASAHAIRTGPNVTVANGTSASLIANSLVHFGPGFTVENGAELSVTIGFD